MAPIDALVERFAALAHSHRIRIVRLLLAAWELGGMTAGELQAQLRIPGSTLNHHLATLERAGLVTSRRDRQWVWYAAVPAGLREMQEFLFQECCSASRTVPVQDTQGGNKP